LRAIWRVVVLRESQWKEEGKEAEGDRQMLLDE
jgi:hypothetical protein